jgi:hypothetical protein
MENRPKILDDKHPSFGCKTAMFLFNNNGNLIIVEASNPWQVQVIERLLLDGQVSPGCEVVAVFRNCSDAGLRSDSITNINYVDFVVDKVQPGKFLVDSVMAYSLRCSMSDAECKVASQKLKKYIDKQNVVQEKLESSLVNLGFKKSKVSKWVNSLPNDYLNSTEFEKLFKDGVQACS